MRHYLMLLVQKLTGHTRYHPENYELDRKTHWSKDIWVSNVFRAYEWLFGRGYGIRPELSSSTEFVNGKKVVNYELYSFEAVVCHIEVLIRNFLKKKLAFEIYAYQFSVAPIGAAQKQLLPWISFSIALDTSTVGTNTTTS